MRRRPFLATLGAGVGVGSGSAGCLDRRPARLHWHTPVGPDQPTDVVLADDVVAVPKRFETYGVETDGTVTWKRFDYGGPVRSVPGGFLAVGAPNYHPRNATNPMVLHRLAADGPVRWAQPADRLETFVGLATDGVRAYLLRGRDDRGRTLVARALTDGRELWRESLDGPARWLRVVDETVVTVGDITVGHDPTSGTVRWRRPTVNETLPPTVAAERLFLTRASPPAVQVLDGDGTRRARYDLPGDRARGPVAVGAGVGVVRTTAGTWGIDPATGARQWPWPETPMPTDTTGRRTVATTGDSVVVVDDRHGVTAVDRGGRRTWRVELPGGATVLTADDQATVYVAGDRGLFALDA